MIGDMMKTLLLFAALTALGAAPMAHAVDAASDIEGIERITLEQEQEEAREEALEEAENNATPAQWVPSDAIDLSVGGSRLGKGHFGFLFARPAVRLYAAKVEGEPGSYWGVLFQYASIPAIFPQYAAARTVPALNKVIGYLNKIGSRVQVFKIVPSAEPGKYEMLAARVVDGEIKAPATANPPVLTLARSIKREDPLAGATIHIGGKKKYSFPRRGLLPKGFQYSLAAIAYKAARLESTWRMDWLPGPYLTAYGKLDDVSLTLAGTNENATATFSVDAKFAKDKIKDREKLYTSPKSAHILGSFAVTRAVPGMFLLAPLGTGQQGAEHVTSRIGLFIDVFDARKALCQDVVEIAFANPDDPKDILMYYEHPDNGEGKGDRPTDPAYAHCAKKTEASQPGEAALP
jgi:hypothetical protein